MFDWIKIIVKTSSVFFCGHPALKSSKESEQLLTLQCILLGGDPDKPPICFQSLCHKWSTSQGWSFFLLPLLLSVNKFVQRLLTYYFCKEQVKIELWLPYLAFNLRNSSLKWHANHFQQLSYIRWLVGREDCSAKLLKQT